MTVAPARMEACASRRERLMFVSVWRVMMVRTVKHLLDDKTGSHAIWFRNARHSSGDGVVTYRHIYIFNWLLSFLSTF